jgi:hypothetical protein
MLLDSSLHPGRSASIALFLLAGALWPAPLTSSSGSPAQPNAPSAALSPQEQYDRLLTTAFEASELPDGFSAVEISAVAVSPTSRIAQHNAIGEVAIGLDGPDWYNRIAYYIFPTEGDARDDFAASAPSEEVSFTRTGSFMPAGFAHPAICYTGTETILPRQPLGSTTCFVRVENVVAASLSVLENNPPAGDNEHAVALAGAAVAHLERVQR